jgi:predicted DCC family thiol-disulfide oxidoreductase YuxK
VRNLDESAFWRRWFRADARGLGALRIALGALLIADLGSRFEHAEALYSNDGVLTNHFALFRPLVDHQFSLFFALSQASDVKAAFCLTFVVYAAFLIGYRTRVFHLLSLLLVTSLHARNLLVELPSDVALHWFLAWTWFLPLGARFSVDAVRMSLAREPEHAPEDLARPRHVPRDVVSLAVLGLTLQIAVMHLGPGLFAAGPTWSDGTALYYALHQPAWTRALGAWAADHVPFRALTLGYRALNVLAGGLVLVPFSPARKGAMLALVLLHGWNAALFRVGLYDWVMLAPALLLLGGRDWDRLRDWLAARRPRLAVYFDADCGICFAIARLLARLDGFGRLTFMAGASEQAPAEVRALADQTVCVQRLPGGSLDVRARAFARICRSLPLLPPIGWLLFTPGISWIADPLYDLVARHRAQISVFFGYQACGLVSSKKAAGAPAAHESGKLARVLRESAALVVLLVAGAALALGIDDETKESGWRAELAACVAYPRLFQVWKPALPEVNPRRGTLVIDAVTLQGRRVDPLASIAKGPLFNAYFERISQPRFADYLDGLRNFIRQKTDQGFTSEKVASFTINWELWPIALPGAEVAADLSDTLAVRRKLIGQP